MCEAIHPFNWDGEASASELKPVSVSCCLYEAVDEDRSGGLRGASE